MKKILIVGLFFLYSTVSLIAQHKHIKGFFKPEVITQKLPTKINESSGLIYFRNKLWTFNDSGGEPCIYELSDDGTVIEQEIRIKNAVNIDWEEISQDENYIYIGDFGNNFGFRRNLTVYKVLKSNIPKSGNISVDAETINFSYKNQLKSSALYRRSAYDCESMVVINDSIIIFSKNWVDEVCNVYKFSAKPGKYELSPISLLNINGLVTGATLSYDKTNLFLIGYKDLMPFIVVFNKFNPNNIVLKHTVYVNFPSIFSYQTEGIAFTSDSTLVISSENTKHSPGSLFKITIKRK